MSDSSEIASISGSTLRFSEDFKSEIEEFRNSLEDELFPGADELRDEDPKSLKRRAKELWELGLEFVELVIQINKCILNKAKGFSRVDRKLLKSFRMDGRKVFCHFVLVKRLYWSKAKEGEKLKKNRWDVFLSHAGEQKGDYVCWLENTVKRELEQYHPHVFFDENALLVGDHPEAKMVHAVLTTQVAVTVLTQDFVVKKWPLLELCLLSARLELQADHDARPIGSPLDPVLDVPDEEFDVLPDLYDDSLAGQWQERGWAVGKEWVDIANMLLLPWDSMPTGYRKSCKLDTDHAKVIVNDVRRTLRGTHEKLPEHSLIEDETPFGIAFDETERRESLAENVCKDRSPDWDKILSELPLRSSNIVGANDFSKMSNLLSLLAEKSRAAASEITVSVVAQALVYGGCRDGIRAWVEAAEQMKSVIQGMSSSHVANEGPSDGLREVLLRAVQKVLSRSCEYDIYVPPLCGNDQWSKSGSDLRSALLEFLNMDVSAQPIFALLGDSGNGKTTFLQETAKSFSEDLKKFLSSGAVLSNVESDASPWISFYQPLQTLSDPKSSPISETLRKAGLAETDLDRLRQYPRVLFLFDGFDEARLGSNWVNVSDLCDWPNARICVACRTEYVSTLDADAAGVFAPKTKLHVPDRSRYAERYVLPFSKNQVEDYVGKYVESFDGVPDGHVDKLSSFMKLINSSAALQELSTNPFLLRVLVEVLNDRTKDEQFVGTAWTRRRIFQEFVSYWVSRQKDRLASDPFQWNLNKFEERCVRHCEAVSREMYVNGSTIVRYFDDELVRTGVEAPPDSASTLWLSEETHVRRSFPFKSMGSGTYGFLHKSLQEYFICEEVLHCARTLEGQWVDATSLITNNHHIASHSLANEPALLRMLGEIAKCDDDFRDQLFSWIWLSRESEDAAILASNAISVLHWGDVQLSGIDFSGIRVPVANLAGANLTHSVFDEADLSECSLAGSLLDFCSFYQAAFQNARFDEMPPIVTSATVNSVAVSPDGLHIVSGSHDGTVRVWSMKNGDCVHTLSGHSAAVTSVAVSPDGLHIVSGSHDGTVRVWSMKNGDCVHTLSGHSGTVTSVAVSPDGLHIVSGSHDGTVRVWSMKNGNLLQRHTGASRIRSNHEGCGLLRDSTIVADAEPAVANCVPIGPMIVVPTENNLEIRAFTYYSNLVIGKHGLSCRGAKLGGERFRLPKHLRNLLEFYGADISGDV